MYFIIHTTLLIKNWEVFILGTILLILYLIAGYWAVGQTIYANKVRIGTWSNLFITQTITGFLLGWLLIPIAIIKKIVQR